MGAPQAKVRLLPPSDLKQDFPGELQPFPPSPVDRIEDLERRIKVLEDLAQRHSWFA
jgi:hypothetical protein